jgi:hypothetical protein
MRVALLLALVACQKPTEPAPDPAIGRWRGETGKTIELRADGTLDMEPGIAPECMNAPLAACRARQTWKHSGDIVALSRGVMRGNPCSCHIQVIDVEFRGDELISGTEHAQRVK